MSLITKVKLNNRQKAIGTILLFPWYLYFAPSIFNFLIKLYIMYVNDNLTSETINTYFNVLITLSTAVFLLIIFRDFIKKNWKIFKQELLENVIWVLTIGIGSAYLFSYIGEFIVNLLLPANTSEATNQTLVVTLVSSNMLLMTFQAVILAPIVEELFFRGLIFNTLRQKSVFWAHLISAFLFGLLHVYSYILAGDMSEWIKLIPYMTAGLAFSYAYEKRQNIIAPIFLHGVKNLIAVILIYIMF
ncbi:CPBP family intramembrane glutamic endopeptidase [Thomasclavelia cocleata]|uniref:CAAX protease self-immunity n=1 Tax=Thomasclavelia cocleata TaxID=69824 RepID=A0A1I0ECM9_9FIRM|nr:CPBP family intramembrane glutamic endopeptidase [Thomasclavelia cocleata]MCR1960817.1 CPBP family intramembrane metalloprotease [Thomasclavelia cocleata]NDO43344.1 CPBP family intramembrane metalloprotease [Thomasclavelia cocleata]PJN80387.1 CPBP family intramembrane metalloprotease [Thomasclavelia cocleata]SET42929.1 CAAX protease self-immunity [Thomasclavelia cocleata]